MTRLVPRPAGIGSLIALLAVFLLPTAGAAAAQAPVPAVVKPTPRQLAAAVAAAHAPTAISLARSNLRQVSQVSSTTLSVGESGTPAYGLNPDFVRGTEGTPAGVLDYVAVTATAGEGTAVTMQVVPQSDGGWHVRSVISGNDETELAAGVRAGEVLLFEPQINGWYALGTGGVRLLRASLPQQPVGQPTSLASYQREVHDRYADKMPGSPYQRDKKIGFTQDTETVHTAERSNSALPIYLGGGVLVLLGGGALLWRRRRKTRDDRVGDELSSGERL